MARKTKLHPRLKSVVPASARRIQIGLRWLSVLAGALVAVQIGRAIDTVQSSDEVPASWWLVTLLLIVVAAVASGLAVAQSMRTQAITERALREQAQSAWSELGPLEISGRQGQLLDLATTGAMRTARYRGGFLSASIASLSAPLLVVVVMGVFLGWRNALFMSLVVVVGPVIVGAFQSMSKDVGDRFRQSQSHLRESFLEGIRALESLSYAGAGSAYAERLAETGELHRRKIMRLLASNQTLILVMDLVFSLAALMLATFLAVHGRADGTLSLGQAVALLLLTLMMVAPVDLIGQFFYIGIGGRAAGRQFSVLMDEVDLLANRTNQLVARDRGETEDGEAAISLRNVVAGWVEGEPVLRGASLTVEGGENVAVVGPSGSGKSTLSAIIQGLIVPSEGQVELSGHPVLPGRKPTSSLAVVEQRSYLFNGTVAENLRLADPEATNEQLWNALEQARLADEIRALPLGLDTPIGDHGSRLSGGQSQRLALARALLKDAPILILDEPTSQVDLKGEAAILQAIEEAAQGRTVLTIAHRKAAVRGADRVVKVDDGLILPVSEGDDD